MKYICFYFQVHQPFRLKPYHFFEIGKNSNYFDEQANASIMRKVAENCYLPTNQLLLDLIKEFGGRFRVTFSISGTAIDQFEQYAPEVLESFQALARTGAVEFLTETWAHSLTALKSKREFILQVNHQRNRIRDLFHHEPTVFRNTELIYSDAIGSMVHQMGFRGMLTEGADHILGWRSPNYLYYSASEPSLKLLLKNYRLSDDIAFRFSDSNWKEWPLTTEKFTNWIKHLPGQEEIVNLFMDYETFGEHQWKHSGIFDFLQALPGQLLADPQVKFITPGQAIELLQPVAPLYIPEHISWADEERNLSAWLGNDLQKDAFDSLYRLESRVAACHDPGILYDWERLQTSDHFYYMCTKYFADGDVHKYFNPYNSPYEAFINYMNVLSDFEIRVNNCVEYRKRPAGKKHTAGSGSSWSKTQVPAISIDHQ